MGHVQADRCPPRHTYVIAEAGVNHNGSPDLAVRLVECAAECGADAVKFQTFTATKLVRTGAAKAAYQAAATGTGDQLEMLRELELPSVAYDRIVRRCIELGIEFMSTPFDIEAADFLLGLGMRRLKVPSGELTHHDFLRDLAARNVPLILSTGMADLEEILEAVDVVRREREHRGFHEPLGDRLTILHCTSNYPAAFDDVNLRAMRTIADATGLPVGYSDHTAGTAVSVAAVALGACVIEKHVTLDRSMAGPDHKASLDPQEFRALVSQIRAVDTALGSAVKAPAAAELPVRALVRRSLTTTVDLRAGQALERRHVALLRPGDGIQPKDASTALGRVLVRDVPAGTTLQWSDLR